MSQNSKTAEWVGGCAGMWVRRQGVSVELTTQLQAMLEFETGAWVTKTRRRQDLERNEVTGATVSGAIGEDPNFLQI